VPDIVGDAERRGEDGRKSEKVENSEYLVILLAVCSEVSLESRNDGILN
jgi:hypothetical protein